LTALHFFYRNFVRMCNAVLPTESEAPFFTERCELLHLSVRRQGLPL